MYVSSIDRRRVSSASWNVRFVSLFRALCAGAQTTNLYCRNLRRRPFRHTTCDTLDQASDLFSCRLFLPRDVRQNR
jgi:hypothetical protein